MRDDEPDARDFEVDEVLAATALALLCRIDDREVWLPRSQFMSGTDVEDKGDQGSVTIPEWLAVEKGLL